jgi:chloramphenicol O-acetyltransferase
MNNMKEKLIAAIAALEKPASEYERGYADALQNILTDIEEQGACEAQNDDAKYINEHTVNYRDIPNVLFTHCGRYY